MFSEQPPAEGFHRRTLGKGSCGVRESAQNKRRALERRERNRSVRQARQAESTPGRRIDGEATNR